MNKNVVVCLSNGSPIIMPWKGNVKAILEQYLSGQAGGEALVDVLYGKVNPSGKLAETFPNHIEEFPSDQNFPGLPRQVEYREGLYIGYRFYETAKVEPLFPFGFGLSYTTFEYSDLSVEVDKDIKVKFTISNTGTVDGKEIAQVYVGKDDSKVHRPAYELKGYKKVLIRAGEKEEVEISIRKDDLKVYQDGFELETGKYQIYLGSSSRDIHLKDEIKLRGNRLEDDGLRTFKNITKSFIVSKEQFEHVLGSEVPDYPLLRPFTMNSVIGELQVTFVGKQIKNMMVKQFNSLIGEEADETTANMIHRMADELPFRALVMLSSGAVSYRRAQGLLDLMNKKPIRGLWTVLRG